MPNRSAFCAARGQGCALFFVLIALSGQLAAETDPSIAGEFSVHPAAIGADTKFMLLVDQPASAHCTTDVQIQITPEVIDLWVAPLADDACPTDGQPARQTLFSPREMLPDGYAFAPTVEVRYRLISDNEVLELDTKTIRFGSSFNHPKRVDSGSWITTDLPYSSLHIDQQDEVISISLLDYDRSGDPVWLYASGQVDGDTFSGKLHRYKESICRLKNCNRGNGEEKGRIRMVLREANDIVINMDTGPNLSTRLKVDHGYVYHRFDMTHSPEARRITAEGAQIPDLVGTWVIGTTGEGDNSARPAAFAAMAIEYLGPSRAFGKEHIFLAFPGTVRRKLGQGAFPAQAVRYAITCTDQRPEVEQTACQIMQISETEFGCLGSFPLAAVGVERIGFEATCTDPAGPYATRFELFRLPPQATKALAPEADDEQTDAPDPGGSQPAPSALDNRAARACHQRSASLNRSDRIERSCD